MLCSRSSIIGLAAAGNCVRLLAKGAYSSRRSSTPKRPKTSPQRARFLIKRGVSEPGGVVHNHIIFDGRWLVARACYEWSEGTSSPVPVRSEPLSAFEPSKATSASLDRSFLRQRAGKHGFESRTGFGRQASLLEIAFEGLALAA